MTSSLLPSSHSEISAVGFFTQGLTHRERGREIVTVSEEERGREGRLSQKCGGCSSARTALNHQQLIQYYNDFSLRFYHHSIYHQLSCFQTGVVPDKVKLPTVYCELEKLSRHSWLQFCNMSKRKTFARIGAQMAGTSGPKITELLSVLMGIVTIHLDPLEMSKWLKLWLKAHIEWPWYLFISVICKDIHNISDCL